MPVLQARLLGPPSVRLDGREVDVSAGKVRALLCYLVATRQVHSRQRLAAFFWPESGERNALASLRTALYDVRKAMGDTASDVLHVERTRVGLTQDVDLSMDVARLEAVGPEHGSVDRRGLEEAVAAYGGPFLEGTAVDGCHEFDDWVFLERERLNNLYLSALCRLGAGHAERGDHAGAAACAKRVLAIDPLREEVHRALMRYLALDGRRSEALAQYRTCAELLQEELGIEPLDATTELFQRIMDDRPLVPEVAQPTAPDRAAAGRARRAIDRRPELPQVLRELDGPLVGRSGARVQIRDAWAAACAGRGSLVLLAGEAGIGKTRLVADLSREIDAEDQGIVVMGRCFESAINEPYGPFVGALRSLLQTVGLDELEIDEVWLRELARLIPELADDLPHGVEAPLDGVRDRDRLFEGVRQVLKAVAQIRPLMVVLDDVQWADETSMSLLGYVARAADSVPMLLTATCRNDDLEHERRAAIRVLSKDHQRIDLRRLTVEETSDLIGRMAGEQSSPVKLGRVVHERTSGNPLFVVETLRAMFDQGTLEVSEGNDAWTTVADAALDDYRELPVPDSIGLIVDGRLERLIDDTRAFLDSAAVLRRDFPFDIVHRASGRPAPTALDALDRLLELGLLREVEGTELSPRYDFQHALVRDRIYQHLSGARRQYLHRQVAGLLESEDAPAADRVAYHYMRGGVRDRACAWSLRAGAGALAIYAAEDAIAHYRTARQLAVSEQEEFAAVGGIGDAQIALGCPDAAIDAYREAIDLAPDLAERAELLRRIARAHDRQGAYDEALDAYEEARELLRGRPVSKTTLRVADGIATVYIRLGRVAEASALCRDALVLLELCDVDEDEHRRAEAWIRNTLGMARLHDGDYVEAIRHLTRSLELKRELGDRLGEATLLNNLGVVYYHQGEDMEALRHYAGSLRIKRAIGDRYGEAIAVTNVALIETHLGHLDRASDHLTAARAAAEQVGASWLEPEIHRVAAQRFLALGDVEAGRREAERALRAAESLGVPAFIGVAHRVLGLARVHAEGDDVAEEHFRTSLAVFEMLDNEHELAKTRAAFGEALLRFGRTEDADTYLKDALTTFEASGASGRAQRIQDLLSDGGGPEG